MSSSRVVSLERDPIPVMRRMGVSGHDGPGPAVTEQVRALGTNGASFLRDVLECVSDRHGNAADLFYSARICYEILNRPKTAIEALWWLALRLDVRGEYSADVWEYIDAIYTQVRGATRETVLAELHSQIAQEHHALIPEVRPEADLILLEGYELGWEYHPGYYDAEWNGEGPSDVPAHLRVWPERDAAG